MRNFRFFIENDKTNLTFKNWPTLTYDIVYELKSKIENEKWSFLYDIDTGASNISESSYLNLTYHVDEEETIDGQDVWEEFKLRYSAHSDRHGSDHTIRIDDYVEDVYDDFIDGKEYIETKISHENYNKLINEGYKACKQWYDDIDKSNIK